MPTPKKVETVEELTELLGRADLAILADYRGMTTGELRELRLRLRPTGAKFHITKNTLLRIAADRTGKEALKPALAGPTAVTFVQGDLAEPVRHLTEAARARNAKIVIKGGLLGTSLLDASGIEQIASLPPREQLIAQVVGNMQAPIANLVYTLQNPLGMLAYTLQSRVQQMEGEAA